MSVTKIHEYSSRPLIRVLCFGLALAMFTSATAEGLYAAGSTVSGELAQRIEDWQRLPKGHHTDRPTKVFLGKNPGRDPIGRGGWWTPKLLRDLAKVRVEERMQEPLDERDFVVAMMPLPVLAPPPGEEGGGSGPGEGKGEGGGDGGSQLNTNTGNRHSKYPVVSWSARGDAGINFTLHHNSKGSYMFELGKGWSHSYDVKISYTPGSSAIIRFGDGTEHPYAEDVNGNFVPPAGVFSTLVKNGNGTWTLTAKDRSKLEFNSSGRLVAVKDANSNQVSIARNAAHRVTSVTDQVSRTLTFAYDGMNRLSSVTDPMGRVWTFGYDTLNNLTGITYPQLGGQLHTRTFTYDANFNMLTEVDLRGKTWFYTYDAEERLTSFKNMFNHIWTWTYSNTAATMTQPNGKTVVHNYSGGLIASKVDQALFSTSYVYNANRQVTSFTDKRGKVWTATYHATNGNRLSVTNPLSQTTSFTYSAGHDLLTETDPLGHISTYTYDSNGNMLTAKDALNRT
jgi:YD repeat-containing protein